MPRAAAPPLILTQGDPAGIGPEIALEAWRRRRDSAVPPFAIIADPAHLAVLGPNVPLAEVGLAEASEVFDEALPVLPLATAVAPVPGRPDTANAGSTIAAIERAVAHVRAGEATAVVTNPIAKRVLYAAGFSHPGHTEFLAALAAREGEAPPRPVMMLWCETLAVVPVTVHIPLAAVPKALSVEVIVETGRIVAADLKRLFGISAPRLAVAGLNPHAGEGGSLGAEDEAIVAPAVAALRAQGIATTGPLPADTMFHARARETFDAALAMYHDQALLPIKTFAFDEAVNVTLGLPFVRTSPDHGTAFDVAGRGVARPDSLIAAMKLAARLAAAAAAVR